MMEWDIDFDIFFLKQKSIDVTLVIWVNQTLQEEIRPWRAQESHQTTLGLFFHFPHMYDDIHILRIFILYSYKCYCFKFQHHISVTKLSMIPPGSV
jgi:hypothetical protein